MIDDFVSSLEVTLSSERLRAYRPSRGDDLAMVTNYFWNMAMCQALYSSLGALEVAMRNAIHNTLVGHFGRDDWYNIPNLLFARDFGSIQRAKRNIQGNKKVVTPGRVVAELNFGFWTSMLSSAYGNSPKGPQIWVSPNSPLLVTAFPYAPASIQPFRGRIHQRFDELRHLRNRVSHHEPIWTGVLFPSGRSGIAGPHVPLADLYANIVDSIGWISPTLRASILLFDQFTAVHDNGRQHIETTLQEWLTT